jgi:hypothetical protein
MAIQDSSSEARGGEKSPRRVGGFVAAALIGIVLLMCLVLLYLHNHSLSMR